METKAREIVHCLGFRYFHGLDDVDRDGSVDRVCSDKLNNEDGGTHDTDSNRQDLLTGTSESCEISARTSTLGHDDARDNSFTSCVISSAKINTYSVGKSEQFQTNSVSADDGGMITAGHGNTTEEESIAMDEINLWHLRALAIQHEGLINSSLRKLCWTKLGGLDQMIFLGNLDFQSLQRNHQLESNEEFQEYCPTYHDTKFELERVMPPSGWHIQSERRRLKAQSVKKLSTSVQHRGGNQNGYQEGLSHVPQFPQTNNSFLPSFSPQSTSTYSSYGSNDLSSIGSDIENSGSTTPLTANTSSTINTINSFQTANSGRATKSNGRNVSRFIFSPNFNNNRTQGGMSGTPKSVSFSPYTEIFAGKETGHSPAHTTAALKGSPANFTTVETGSLISSSLFSPNTPFITSPSNEMESGNSPEDLVLPQCQGNQIHHSTQSSSRNAGDSMYPYPQSYLQYTQSSHANHDEQQQQQQQREDEQKSTSQQSRKKKKKKKKDRRMQERKLYLLDVASSAFYLANRDMSDRDGRIGSIKTYYSYFPGVQDLIAVLLLNLDSPSLSILVLKQLLRTHLWVFASTQAEDDFYDECEDVSSNHMANSTILSSVLDRSSESSPDDTGRSSDTRSSQRKRGSWINQQSDGFNFLSLSFLPLLKVLDTKLHASLMSSTDTHTSDTDSAAGENTNRILSMALPCGKILQKWIFSWFCCNHSLPIEAVSRIVDFLMASHPFMPL